jgi:CRISPR-associated endonuclease/helicase Cas3
MIANNLPSVSNIIVDSEKYWAHIGGRTSKETLEEHVELVLKYAKLIVDTESVDLILDKLSTAISDKQEVASFIKLLFVTSMAYHDLGKINPNFQVVKMKNNDFKEKSLSIKSQHSILSAHIFLHYFIEKINFSKFDNNQKILLFGITYLFCFPIIKHHSPFIDKESSFTIEIFKELFDFLNKCGISLPFKASSNLIDRKERLLAQIDEKQFFPLFALLKLSYSLLTACDYYATNDYMADMKVDDFGILTPGLKKKISENFKTKKDYNQNLFEKFDEHLETPFSELQEQSGENLNLLRQKMNAEAISTLRQNPNNLWYYIEAPTGAGKTNLSLACISELLQLDDSLNKVFYVFPFTTLITQTYQGIQETIGLNNDEMIQLHSKAGFHSKEESKDGEYGSDKRIYLDNLFVNYPFCVTSHVRFFDVLKGNGKESNYLLHRLCNSIVVIDELQTYNPSHWDKVLFFVENYARLFNMRFIIMSATLPKIDALSDTAKGKFVNLTPNKKQYFSNKNFAGRIEFDFSLLDNPKPTREKKEDYLLELAQFIYSNAESYFEKYGHSRVLIEFITKNTASHFLRLLSENEDFNSYKLYILSGDILEPQRRKVIQELKREKFDKVVLVSTQVVEAGVDIDMDLGFKDRSLLDSDEQLAGRINRNALKKDCKVFLFDCDSSDTIYGKDKRYKEQQRNEEIYSGFKEILQNKEFDKLYEKVFEDVKKADWTDDNKLKNYLEHFKRFDFNSIHNNFKLIEDNGSESLYIPLDIDKPEGYTLEQLEKWGIVNDVEQLSGEKLFDNYISIIENKEADFTLKKIDLKKLTGLMSQFTISIYPNIKNKLGGLFDEERGAYGYLYLSHYEGCYKLEEGFNLEKAERDVIL